MTLILFVIFKFSWISWIIWNHEIKNSTNICHHLHFVYIHGLSAENLRTYVSTKIQFFLRPQKLVSTVWEFEIDEVWQCIVGTNLYWEVSHVTRGTKRKKIKKILKCPHPQRISIYGLPSHGKCRSLWLKLISHWTKITDSKTKLNNRNSIWKTRNT
jgi:hypothetical protein